MKIFQVINKAELPFSFCKNGFRLLMAVMMLIILSVKPDIMYAQDGAMDAGFNAIDAGVQVPYGVRNGIFNGKVTAIGIQPDGKILIGGQFDSYNGSAANFLARLNADGSLDAGFNAGTASLSSDVRKIALQSDGKILVCGAFGFKRLLTNGSPDAGFNAGGTGFNGSVSDFVVLQSGKIIVAGEFTSYNGSDANYLLRLNTDGTRDISFNSDASGSDGPLKCVSVQRDGKIFIAGNMTMYNDIPVNYIARLNANGSYDPGFVNSGELINSAVGTIAVQSDGKIYASGGTQVIRFNENGTTDNTFNIAAANNGIYEKVNQVLLQHDGKLLISWGEYSYGYRDASSDQKIFRRNADGTNDNSFDYAHQFVVEFIYCMAIQTDGKLLVGQGFSNYGLYRDTYWSGLILKGLKDNGINRYYPDGHADEAFNTIPSVKGANGAVKAIAMQPDGKILLGGYFFSYNGESVNYLVRINPDGSRDYGFNPGQSGPNNAVYDIAVQPDGKIIIAGVFTRFNGQYRNSLCRLNSDGSIDNSFTYAITSFYSDYINKVHLLADGKLLIGKYFFDPLVKLNSDGSWDPGFDVNIRQNNFYSIPVIHSISVQPDGKIIAGGSFDRADNNSFTANLARFLPDGHVDPSFNVDPVYSGVGPDNEVYSNTILPDGKILIGGAFNSYRSFNQTTSAGKLARLTSAGWIDTSFNRGGAGFNGEVYSIYVQPDGKILVGGNFSAYNGQPANRLVRLKADGSRDDSFNLNGSGANNIIYAVNMPASVNKVLIGGEFTSYNGDGKNRAARVNTCSKPPSITRVNICSNQLPYSWNGNSYSAAGTYMVNFSQPDGCDSVANLVLNVVPGGAGTIAGPARACPYMGIAGDTATYTIDIAQGSTITWSVSNAATMIITGGQSTTSVRIKYTDAFTSGVVYARVANTACGTPIKRYLSVGMSLPATPSTITASTTNICPVLEESGNGNLIPVTYTIRKVATATSYNWTSQANTTFIIHPNGPGVNDTTIQLYFTDSYSFTTSPVTVQAVNDCGAGPMRSLTISRLVPSAPGAISGPVNVCDYMSPSGPAATYTVTPVSGLSYYWTIPENAINVTGQNTNSVSFIYPSGFTIGSVSVVAYNGCGASTARSLSVRKYSAATPGAITATAIGACPDRTFSYSIAAFPNYATSLTWTVPTGAVILSGQGTTSILVSYPPASVNGTVSVQSFNNCSASSRRSISVKLTACAPPFASNSQTGKEADQPADWKVTLDATLYPNPAAGAFSLMVTSGSNDMVYVRLMDITGKPISQMNTVPGKTLQFGNGLVPGVYLVEVRQGDQRKVIRGVKL